MSVMDQKTVRKVARLAQIEVQDSEIEAVGKKLEGILGFVEQLSEVNTDNVETLSSVNEIPLVLREDAVTDGGIADKVLKNAPESQEGFFVVSKIVE